MRKFTIKQCFCQKFSIISHLAKGVCLLGQPLPMVDHNKCSTNLTHAILNGMQIWKDQVYKPDFKRSVPSFLGFIPKFKTCQNQSVEVLALLYSASSKFSIIDSMIKSSSSSSSSSWSLYHRSASVLLRQSSSEP